MAPTSTRLFQFVKIFRHVLLTPSLALTSELIQPISSVKQHVSFPPDMFVFTLKSNKLSQWYEVSVLAHSKGKVHTQLLIGNSCKITQTQIATDFLFIFHACWCSYFYSECLLHLYLVFISLFGNTGERSENKHYYYWINLILCRISMLHHLT